MLNLDVFLVNLLDERQRFPTLACILHHYIILLGCMRLRSFWTSKAGFKTNSILFPQEKIPIDRCIKAFSIIPHSSVYLTIKWGFLVCLKCSFVMPLPLFLRQTRDFYDHQARMYWEALVASWPPDFLKSKFLGTIQSGMGISNLLMPICAANLQLISWPRKRVESLWINIKTMSSTLSVAKNTQWRWGITRSKI